DFYTQFSRIGSPVYSWNAREHYSIDAFYEGTLAMMVNYSWQYQTIKQKNAKLNIGVAPLPQFQDATLVNLANYWGYAVAKEKPAAVVTVGEGAEPISVEKQNYLRTHESWQFLKYLAMPHTNKTMTLTNGLTGTTQEVTFEFDPTSKYLEETGKPAARRDIITKQQQDVILAPFVYGNLIAKNKYQGNPEGMDGILIDMIDNVVRGEKNIPEALSTATSRINLLTR
ncbi:MAG: extracellular solute-binding protein, partial [Candidatus Moranbacteria bacterium]|nr:extracellular solute-binding protein [Candidatus Moranbacteria bacterium]